MDRVNTSRCLASALAFVVACIMAVGHANASNEVSFVDVVRQVQPKVVKLYGAGGLRGLEAYQTGLLISAEGHILTVWSYVLDADEVTVVLDDGRRFFAKHVAADPLTEIAVLKFEPAGEPLPFFDFSQAAIAEPGSRVLAFSNLFGIATGDEPVSVLQGMIAAIAPLDARRGAFATNFGGEVYVIDAAANNPGAAGGALTDLQGRLLGMLGKELRSQVTGTWLNYALPTEAIAPTIEEMLSGNFTPPDLSDIDKPDRPLTLSALGIVLVPDVVIRTPPYIDRVIPNSSADRAGLRPDDLLVMIDAQMATSCRETQRLINRYEHSAAMNVAILRDGALLEFTLQAGSENAAPESAEGGDASIDTPSDVVPATDAASGRTETSAEE